MATSSHRQNHAKNTSSTKVSSRIIRYLRSTHQNYCEQIGYGVEETFLYGNPLLPVLPVDIAQDSLMIVGAYPSARFATVNSLRDVPVGDNLHPFSQETYFDGGGIRRQASEVELRKFYLDPLGLTRSACWITDLVKVFLFKPGHAEKYRKLGRTVKESRSQFRTLANQSLSFLNDEIRLANPVAILLLGAEVTSIVLGISESAAKELMRRAEPVAYELEERNTLAYPAAHPGILMRGGEKNRWPEITNERLVPRLQSDLPRLTAERKK